MRHIVLFICLLGCFITNKAQDLILNESQSIPMNNGEYSSIQEVKLVFDLSNIDYGSVPPETCGVISSMSSSRNITLYKGNATTGELMATLKKTISDTSPDFKVGNSIELKFDQEYILEPGQEYTLKISKNAIKFSSPQSTGSIATIPETLISFKGADSSETLMMVSASPTIASEISELGLMTITFNQEVEISENAVAELYEGDVLVKSANIEMSENDGNSITADFGNEALYVSHHYNVKISDNTIFSKSTKDSYKAISISYDGAAYKYLSYGRISPKQGDVNYLATVSVPVSCEDGYNLGRAKAPTAYLYKDGVEEPVQSVTCTLGLDGKSWIIPFYNFSLEPNATYKVVMPAEQFSIWKILENGGYNEVKDMTNPELTLTYTTPTDIVLPSPIEFGAIEPSETVLKKLDNIKINLNRYEFEDVTYYPIFATSSLVAGWNEIYLYEDGVEEPIANIAMDMKWDSTNNYWLEPISAPSINLYADKTYRLVVPKGFIICHDRDLAEISANQELVVNLTGTAKDEYDVTFTLADVGSMKSIVAAGKTVTVDLEGTEDWKVSAVIFNGEAVETEGSTYTTPAIEDDSTVEVEYEYAREIDYNFTTGVDMTEICPYGVVSEGENLIISGVQPGDAIAIYTTGGLKVADLPTVPQNMDRVAVSLPTGQAYIILINGKSLKFLHQ